ncbi:selenocysteine-specific translation elongation factor [Pseudomonas sp. PCH199]|uniref:selenocysteine-specific translation elongation factor n=1 Tax=unclassified Pseudomonas TaxID=196821 RepID=UPI000BDD12EB|nr:MULTISPECIES: selenocysteine-specific translation elongation factor [unclassified Pseudomonas]MCW8275116.1 selenocysteine-specific translation elongation factor [Pseudomonas sp. PCH199]PAM84788.1 selenocysteine-specific translation elongation factor [Pseudomonas sp. ERMR1:02]
MIVGTAGHIDHGKTALLQALTGQAGDRRREERERGMTIDLGYLYAALEPGAALTGFIDVPGHERFTHNMLAGAQGIDLVLLVVAADDGVMPQTREHLAIVELLGIPRALVAISKCDRVEPSRVQAVRGQISNLLAPGPYAGAPLIALSSVTGEGIETLREALLNAQREVLQRSLDGGFRLWIDRAFSVAGAGIVVTGTALSGQVAVGDTLVLGPPGKPVRVRGLHAQNKAAQTAMAGQRVALNLSGERLALEQIHRGQWLVAEWLYAPSQRIDIDLHLLASEPRAVEHFQPVHVHVGTQDVTGRVALLEGSSLAPGERMFAQVLLNAPVQVVRGDPLILRDQSAQRTLGGGRVLDPFAPTRQRRSLERIAQLQALTHATNLEEILPALLANSDTGLDPQRLERQFNHRRANWMLPEEVRLIETRQGPVLFNATRWQALKVELLQHLARFHELEPDQMGPDRDRLRRFAGTALDRPTFISLLDELLASGAVVASGPWLHLPDHQVRLSEEDEALWQQLQPQFEAAGFDPPWVRELGHDEVTVRLLLRKMARLGLVHQVVRDLFYTDSMIRRLAAMLMQLADADPVIQVAAFRDTVGLGRKRSIQILEYFDRLGLTRRFGDKRHIRLDNALALRTRH